MTRKVYYSDCGWDYWCILENDNTLTFGLGNCREGGDIITSNFTPNGCQTDVNNYLTAVDNYMIEIKHDMPKYYKNIIQMLRNNGFEYEPWKTFIRASEKYIWIKTVDMTLEEIEKELGYKINIVKTKKENKR